MIGYRISRAQLEALIDAEKAGWLARARTRTDDFRNRGRYEESSSIWSEIKRAYMRHQGEGKCVYCEQKIEGMGLGAVAQDVEHFRPKGNVRAWEVPAEIAAENIPFTAPAGGGAGYHLLPYDIFNYAAACKPCNGVLKRDFFPIAGAYQLAGDAPETLLAERPYLIYPLGDFDTPPENLIRFFGVSPRPVAANGYDRHRALVTIAFFDLDDVVVRKDLIIARVMMILLLYRYLEDLRLAADNQALARNVVATLTSPRAEHTACARDFQALYAADPQEAKKVVDLAATYLESGSG